MADEGPRSGHITPKDIFSCTAPLHYARKREGGRKMHRRLGELLEAVPGERIRFKDADIRGVTCDSRSVRAGWLFVTVPGTKENGADYVADAVAHGASAVVCEAPAPQTKVPVFVVSDAREALADLASRFYQDPSERLNIIAVTGTNGKTTTTFLLRSILEAAGEKPGLLGTIEYAIGGKSVASPMTTPPADELQRMFWEMANAGSRSAIMEVSSHSLVQKRVHGIRFAAGVFTNLTRDHLDYHRTHEEYLDAKGRLFRSLAPKAVAALNADDPAASIYAGETAGHVVLYGLQKPAEITAEIESGSFGGTNLRLRFGSETIPVHSKLIGTHNVYNILAAAATCWKMGYDLDAIRVGIESMTAVPGRLEPVDAGQDFAVLVDYAHTDDALRNVLSCVRPLLRGRLVLVFGCGGDRDRGKRPRMGRVADEMSDSVVITSDNARTEEPLDIIREVAEGFVSRKYLIEPDRRKAIRLAITMAKKDDVVLIAGKGHENYQIFKDGPRPFDDRQVAREILMELVKK